jgi:hypothetical protein
LKEKFQPKARPAAPAEAPGATARETQLEEQIIAAIIKDGEKGVHAARNFLSAEDFADTACRTIFLALLERSGFDGALMDTLNDKARETAGRLFMENEALADKPGVTPPDLPALISKLRENQLKKQRSEIKRRMALPGEDRDRLLEEFNAITRELNHLKEPPAASN